MPREHKLKITIPAATGKRDQGKIRKADPSELHCIKMIQNADSEIWQPKFCLPKFCLDAWNKGTGWGNRPTEWNFLGLWPWHVVKFVEKFR